MPRLDLKIDWMVIDLAYYYTLLVTYFVSSERTAPHDLPRLG